MNTIGLKNLAGRISIFAQDVLVVILSFAIAFWLRIKLEAIFPSLHRLYIRDVGEFLIRNWWLMLIYIVVFISEGLYSKNMTFWEELKAILKGVVIAMLISFSFVALAKLNPYISRLILILQPVVLLIILPIYKYLFKKLLYILGLWQLPVLEVKVNTRVSVRKPLFVNKYLGYSVVDSIDLTIKDKADLESAYRNIKDRLKSGKYAGVVVVVPDTSDPLISQLIEKIYFVTSRILVVPEFLGFDIMNSNVVHLMYENLFIFDIKKGLNKKRSKIIKRIIDILVGIVVLLLTWPIFLVVSLIIYLKDGAPVFFTHKRYGKGGKTFNFVKFRTMYNNNDKILEEYLKKNPKLKKYWDKYQKLPLKKDPRIIKGIGYFLRKTNLDELPQVFNLLKGDISLVGPRPYMPREREKMGDYFDRILAVTPGITGLWQVSGRNKRTFAKRMQIDVWYIQNWSLWLDFVILAKTVLMLIRGR